MMDIFEQAVFFEQIVEIRKTAKTILSLVGIWLAALLLVVILLLFLPQLLGAFSLLLAAGVLYGAYKLSLRLMVEYEYIITNGTFDVDQIIARSSRKRVMSFELSDVERLEKYNPAARPVGSYKKTVIACNEDDPDAYFAVVNEKEKGSYLIVFAPDERMRGAIVKSLPKFIAISAFK